MTKSDFLLSVNVKVSCNVPSRWAQLVSSFTHVQYTQTGTIRQTDGLLVPMIGLVPIEKDVIPVVLLVNMHLIKGTLIIFPCDQAGYRAIPMVHWYQWYDWYQWKSTLFQWFYW